MLCNVSPHLISFYNDSKMLFFPQFHQNYFFNIILSNGIIIIFNINEHISWTFEIHVVRQGPIIFQKMQIVRKANILLNWLAGQHKLALLNSKPQTRVH